MANSKWHMVRPISDLRLLISSVCALLFALNVPAHAQQPKKVARIGYLTAQSAVAEQPRLEAFRQALRALGYVDGQNVVIEFRHTDGKFERLPDVAAELVRLKVDVLITTATNGA